MDKLVTDNNCPRLNSGKHFRVHALNSAPHCNPISLSDTCHHRASFKVKSKHFFRLFFHFFFIQNDSVEHVLKRTNFHSICKEKQEKDGKNNKKKKAKM